VDTNDFRMFVRGGIALISVVALILLTAFAVIDPKLGGGAIISIASSAVSYYYASKKEEL